MSQKEIDYCVKQIFGTPRIGDEPGEGIHPLWKTVKQYSNDQLWSPAMCRLFKANSREGEILLGRGIHMNLNFDTLHITDIISD